MGELFLTFDRPDGSEITLRFEQAIVMAALMREHPGSTWHPNNCGCCVTVHPEGDPARGYVIDESGGYDYHEFPPKEPS